MIQVKTGGACLSGRLAQVSAQRDVRAPGCTSAVLQRAQVAAPLRATAVLQRARGAAFKRTAAVQPRAQVSSARPSSRPGSTSLPSSSARARRFAVGQHAPGIGNVDRLLRRRKKS